MTRNLRIDDVLNWLSGLTMMGALYLVFVYAPTEAVMGDVQRIFYFHVSSAWGGFFAFFITLIAGIMYLRTGSREWDIVALSSVEIGLTFTTMATITGSIWAKATWNAWWPWQQELRLVLISVLLLLYWAYLMLRAFVEGEERKARFAAVYGIVAFASVPFTFMSIRWWQGLHPVIFESEGMNLTPPMLATFLFCLLTFTILYFTLLIHRIRLGRTADQVEGLQEKLRSAQGG